VQLTPPELDRFVALSPVSPTPVQPMDRLAAELGLPTGRLWVKRDDLTGLGGGGNKVRKLEHLCADAMAKGCDTLVTGGGRQSNHVRMSAAAANFLGLRCTIVLGSEAPDEPTGNVVLDQVLAPEIVWAGPLDYYDLERAIVAEAERLRDVGRQPYAMPLGGASTVGQLGYVRAALELRGQLPDTSLIVTADGTGGTHAGLVAGWGDHQAVLGVDVGTRPDLDDAVPREAKAAARLAGLPEPVGTGQIDHEQIGDGYGAPTRACREALHLAARCEGLLLDPVYSGKAMAGLIQAARAGRLPDDGTIVFLATGGLPALLTPRYTAWVTDWPI
jgi:1-aminocyclopropane-1-carboxylate deaminase/D-cysteine desulfhydrase-like pyridoxal-dependent ACC family enzyme